MKPHEPICVYCNEPIPANITPTPIADGKFATHEVNLVAHPSYAFHGKPALADACLVCGFTSIKGDPYGDAKCETCGAAYEYEEGHQLSARDVRKLADECRRLSQLIEHGRLDDACVPWPSPIPVSERLPECCQHGHGMESQPLLFFHRWDQRWYGGYYDSDAGKWFYANERPARDDYGLKYGRDPDESPVTHWLPMPPMPE